MVDTETLSGIALLADRIKTFNVGISTPDSDSEDTRKLEEKKAEIKKLEDKLEKLKLRENDKEKDVESKLRELQSRYKHALYSESMTEEVSSTEIANLEHKILSAELRKKKISKMFMELRKAEQVDICFMMDCTGSMSSYINEAKTVVHRVVDKLDKKFQDFKLRCAFVGYRDHCDGDKRISLMQFGTDKDAFKAFVTNLEATGGGDECEDVFGGLESVNSLEWVKKGFFLFTVH